MHGKKLHCVFYICSNTSLLSPSPCRPIRASQPNWKSKVHPKPYAPKLNPLNSKPLNPAPSTFCKSLSCVFLLDSTDLRGNTGAFCAAEVQRPAAPNSGSIGLVYLVVLCREHKMETIIVYRGYDGYIGLNWAQACKL